MRPGSKLTALAAGALLALSGAAIRDAGAQQQDDGARHEPTTETMTGTGPAGPMGGMRHGSMMGDGSMGCGMGGGRMDSLPMGMHGRMGMDGLMGTDLSLDRILAAPNLTETQRSTLRIRARALERELWKLGGEAMDARFRLEDVMRQDRPAPEAVGKAMSALFDVQRRSVEARVAALNDARDVLTDEQRQALEQGRGSGMGMQGMGMHGMGMGGMRPGQP